MTTKPKTDPDPSPPADPAPVADHAGAVESTPFTPEQRAVRMADVSALNPVPVARDASVKVPDDALTLEEARAAGVFISAGMMSDLQHHGFVRSPVDGQYIVVSRDEVAGA